MAKFGEQIELPFVIVPWSANLTFDFDVSAHQAVLLQGNTVITFTNAKEGARYMIAFQQDATGNRLVTWPAAAHFRSGSSDSTLSTGAGAIDIYEAIVRNNIGYVIPYGKNFT